MNYLKRANAQPSDFSLPRLDDGVARDGDTIENYAGVPLAPELRRRIQRFMDSSVCPFPNDQEKAIALLVKLGLTKVEEMEQEHQPDGADLDPTEEPALASAKPATNMAQRKLLLQRLGR